MPSPSTSTTATTTGDPRYAIKTTEPSAVVTVGEDTRSFYSFNRVFDRPMGIAVVGGGGFIGKFIVEQVPAIDAKIVGCSLSRKAVDAEKQAREVGLRPDQVVSDYHALINNPDVDVLVVASDNASHFEIAEAALKKGKHVICEKPVAISVEQARELSQLAEALGLEFTLNHFYAQYSQVSTLASIVQTDSDKRSLTIDPSFLDPKLSLGTEKINVELGDLKSVTGSYLQDWVLQTLREKRAEAGGAELPADLGKWRLMKDRQGPSCAYGDIGVHIVEVLSHILGSLPVEVLDKKLTKEAEGHQFPLDVRAEATLKFANGVVAKTVASQIDQGTHNDLSVELEFEGGTLKWSNRDANVITFEGAATNGKLIRLERDRPGVGGLSAEAKLLQTVVQGHDQGHGHAQTHLLRLFGDSICRNHLKAAGEPIVGKAGYIPTGALGIAEMEIVEKVAA